MTTNTALWDSVCKTDPAHTSKITGKLYQGTSPRPQWLVRRATETFGPAGIGWGFTIVSERIEEGPPGEKVHIARIKVWYILDGIRGEVEHMGATPFSGLRASGKPFIDDDAVKKSVTDALVKALSMIGFAGDIFLGRYDDSKYIEEVRAEFRNDDAVIDPRQVAELRRLIKETDTDEQRFLQFLRVGSLQVLPAADFTRAICALKSKKAISATGKANAQMASEH